MKTFCMLLASAACLLLTVSANAQVNAPEILNWTASTDATYIIDDGQSCIVVENDASDNAKTITFKLPDNTSGVITVTLNSDFNELGYNGSYYSNYDVLTAGDVTWRKNSGSTSKTVTSTSGTIQIKFTNGSNNNSIFLLTVTARISSRNLNWVNIPDNAIYTIKCGEDYTITKNTGDNDKENFVTFKLPDGYSGSITMQINSFNNMGKNGSNYDQMIANGTSDEVLNTISTCATWQENSGDLNTVDGKVTQKLVTSNNGTATLQFINNANDWRGNYKSGFTITVHAECTQYYTLLCGDTFNITKGKDDAEYTMDYCFKLPSGILGNITVELLENDLGHNTHTGRHDSIVLHDYGNNRSGWYQHTTTSSEFHTTPTGTSFTSTSGKLGVQFHNYSTGSKSGYKLRVTTDCGDINYDTIPILCGSMDTIAKNLSEAEGTEVKTFNFSLPANRDGSIEVTLLTDYSDLGANAYINRNFQNYIGWDYDQLNVIIDSDTTHWQNNSGESIPRTITSDSGRISVQFFNGSTSNSSYRYVVEAMCNFVEVTYNTTENSNCGANATQIPPETVYRNSSEPVNVTDISPIYCPSGNEDMAFDHWNTSPDGTGTDYYPGDPLDGINSDITLYAIYDNYTLTYDTKSNCPSQTVTIPDQSAVVTTHVSNTEPNPCGDYQFVGWNTEEDGSGTSYGPGDEITLSGNTTLHAQYCKPFTATISGSNTGCLGTSANLSASHNNAEATSATIQYLWNDDNNSATANMNERLTNTKTYVVTVTYKNVCSATASQEVVVMAPDAEAYGLKDNDFVWTSACSGFEEYWNKSDNWVIYNQGTGKYTLATDNALPTSANNTFVVSFGTSCVTKDPTLYAESYTNDLTIGTGHTVNVASEKLHIYGNLINDGSLSETGTVEFNGNSDEYIKNSLTFNNVVFNQQSVNMIKSIDENSPIEITIKGNAIFTTGIVDANVTFVDILNHAKVANENPLTYNSFVNRSVTKEGKCNNFVFPTGNDYVLGTVTATLPGTTECPKVTVSYHHYDGENVDGSHGFTTDDMPRWWNKADMCAENDAKFDHVSNYEYWNVSTAATLENVSLTVSSPAAADHYTTEQYSNEYVYGTIYSNGCWMQASSSHATSDDGKTIVLDGVKIPAVSLRATTPSWLTFASINPSAVLPIELMSFTAKCESYGALLEWATASERDNDYFIIEHSSDAMNFSEIARIAGAGNSISTLNYSYVDYNMFGGDNYYRLIQVDYDGTRSASEIIVLNCGDMISEEPTVDAYPNPFNNELEISLKNFNNTPAKIELFDMLGKLVYFEEVDSTLNQYDTTLQLGHIAQATYTMRVCAGDNVIVKQIVKR